MQPNILKCWQSGLFIWKVQMEPNHYKWIKFVTSTLCAKDNKTVHKLETEVSNAKRSKSDEGWNGMENDKKTGIRNLHRKKQIYKSHQRTKVILSKKGHLPGAVGATTAVAMPPF
ncbi:hypothetical protein HanLR1_Chr00c0124g0714071 [Helianthus annuus]|nr:hypothetical protein HanHA89_Chr11g0449791 [Helianthus annuus]KAJ0823950.1 hypothetical protein HanLR1_Chr00c0124g0714071 [Helianthus annuus]